MWQTGQEPGRARVGSSSDSPRTLLLGSSWAGGRVRGGREGGEASGGSERHRAAGMSVLS